MRTTVSIDDNLLIAAKDRARERDQTLGRFLEDAVRRELAAQPTTAGPPLPVIRGRGGPRPGLDMTSNRALREAADEGLPLHKLR